MLRRTQSEVARRQVILDNLKKQMSLLVVSGSPLSPGSGAPNTSNNSGRNSSSTFSELGMNPLQNQTSAGLAQRQQEVIKLQDDMLEDLSKGVDRLHGQAVQIGEEASNQTKLLDKLDNQVEGATTELREQAAHAEKINRSTRMCSYYMCVAAEVVVIVVLLIFMFGVMH